MNSGYLSMIPDLHPLILVAAVIPLLLSFFLLLFQMIRFHLGSWRVLAKTLQLLGNSSENIQTSTRENLAAFESVLTAGGPIISEQFLKSWTRMKSQIDQHYHGPFLPSSDAFFNLEHLAGVDKRNSNVRKTGSSLQIFWLFQILIMLLPPAAAWLIAPPSFAVSLILGLYGFLLLAIFKLIFLLIETLSWQNLQNQFTHFSEAFDRIIPVVDKDSATSFEIARVEQSRIGEALSSSLQTIKEQQQQGMTELAERFAGQLTDTVDSRMTKLAATLKETQHGLSSMNESLAEHLTQLKNTLLTQRSTLDDAGHKILLASQEQTKMLSLAAASQEKSILHTAKLLESILSDASQVHVQIMSRNEELQAAFIEKTEGLQTSIMEKAGELHRHTAELSDSHYHSFSVLCQQQTDQMEQLHQNMEQLIQQNNNFREIAAAMLQQAGDIQQQTAIDLVSSQATIQDAVMAIDTTFQGITDQMNTAMINAGREIASGIKEVTADNAEAIEKLTQQAQRLRQDYDTYLIRQEEETKTALISLDQHIQDIFAKVSEEMRAMLIRSSQESKDNFLEASRVQQELALRLTSSQNSIDAAISGVNQLVSGITDRMNEAMASAGREIASGIKEVTGDNAEAITRLAEQSLQLKQDYDRYFTGMETQTRNAYEDMDFHVQNIIAKVSEEFGTLLTDQRTQSRSIMESYNDSTTNLMMSFEQQANSINLYAKEISYDVGELSQNLKNSVSEFSLSMQDTIHQTLAEFDAGLAELTLRISNTVESICDAVEDLPDALGRI